MSTAPWSSPPLSGQPPLPGQSPFPGQSSPSPLGGAVPPPPPGPGVHPPFPAPPVEGKGRRIGVGFGVAGGVLLLICGGGAAAVIGLTTAADDALDEQATVVVERYMDSVRDRDFAEAYDQLCRDARADETEAEYTSRMSATEPVRSYDVGDLDLLNWNVPVDVTYGDGDRDRLRARIAQNTSTGAFEVCEVGE